MAVVELKIVLPETNRLFIAILGDKEIAFSVEEDVIIIFEPPDKLLNLRIPKFISENIP